jgi:uncharacterized LabA/DUF88 family protein
MNYFSELEEKEIMAIQRGVQVIDGSHLFANIRTIWDDHPELKDLKLRVDVLSRIMQQQWSPYTGPTIRSVFYFKKDDKRIEQMLVIPAAGTPNLKSHWTINQCAQSNPKIPETEIAKINPKYHDQIHRGEKGLDMELACDVLELVATGKIDALVFLVNDGDFLPLFKAVQRLGANAYLISLDSKQAIQKDLVNQADLYQTLDPHLNELFNYTPPPVETTD